jgi:hypothetical protein
MTTAPPCILPAVAGDVGTGIILACCAFVDDDGVIGGVTVDDVAVVPALLLGLTIFHSIPIISTCPCTSTIKDK